MYSHIQTIPPTFCVISTPVFKIHKGINWSGEDSRIDDICATAQELLETKYNTCLSPQTWELGLDRWKDFIYLPRYPVTSVVVKYYDPDDQLRTLSTDDYYLDLKRQPARINIRNIPATSTNVSPKWLITYGTGYGSETACPLVLRTTVLRLATYFYDNPAAYGDGDVKELPEGIARIGGLFGMPMSGSWGMQ